MFGNVHVATDQINDVDDWMISIAAQRGKITLLSTSDSKECWSVIAARSKCDSQWITLYDSMPRNIRQFAAETAAVSGCVTIGIMIDPLQEWSFRLIEGPNALGEFHWIAPVAELKKLESSVIEIEKQKLVDLGLHIRSSCSGLAKLKERIASKQRIESSDPRVEIGYRARISRNELLPPAPELDDELPAILARTIPGTRASRFRKMLAKPHLTVEQMAAEFAHYLEITDPFLSIEDAQQASMDNQFYWYKQWNFR